MPDLMERLNQWGPWYLLVFGVIGMLQSTVFYGPYTRLWKRIMNSAAVRRLTEQENTPDIHRKMAEWARRDIDAPSMRWLGVFMSVAMIAGGVAWLTYR